MSWRNSNGKEKINERRKTRGQLLTGTETRDAIHIAIAPAVAGETLKPGTHVWLSGNEAFKGVEGSALGVVDPFLAKPVKKGERFYICLYPNTITGLRHHWEHPAFSEVVAMSEAAKHEAAKEELREWIKDFAESFGQTYEELMDAAEDYSRTGDYAKDNTEGYKDVSSDQWALFWMYYQTLTGDKLENFDNEYDRKSAPFTCSC